MLVTIVLEISYDLSELPSATCPSPQDWREPNLCHGWHGRMGSFVLTLRGLAGLRGRAEVPAWQSLQDRYARQERTSWFTVLNMFQVWHYQVVSCQSDCCCNNSQYMIMLMYAPNVTCFWR